MTAMNLDWIQQEENSIIYVGDTMCSWCYGFAPELDKFIANHPELKIRLVQGGLRPNNDQKIHEMKDFVAQEGLNHSKMRAFAISFFHDHETFSIMK